MFSFFKKKIKQPTACNHKWKDFPWFDVYGRDSLTEQYFFKIMEPYVCIKCKERQDKMLMRFASDSAEERDRMLEECKKKYKGKLLDMPEVEDMVQDEILVDREYLKLLEQFENPNDRFDKLDLFTGVHKAGGQ